MAFDATIRAEVLQELLKPLCALVDEAKLSVGGGVQTRAVDPANVGMVDIEADADAFEDFDGDDELLGLDLERMADVVGMADSESLVSMSLDERTRKLTVAFDGLEYTLALLDPESIREEPDIPDLDLPGVAVVEGREIGRAVTAADMVSDHIEISAGDGELAFRAEGDTDDVEVLLDDDRLLDAPDVPDGVSSLFSLDYMKSINKPLSTATECSLVIGSEMPLKMRYSLGDGDVSVTNMLAPRIQSG